MVKRKSASAWLCFTVDLQFGVLSQRSSMIRAPWLEIIRLCTWGYRLYCGCIPIRNVCMYVYMYICIYIYIYILCTKHLSYVQNCSNARPLSLHLFEAVGVRCDSCWLCSASVTSGAVSLRGTLPNRASCARRPKNQIGAGLGVFGQLEPL